MSRGGQRGIVRLALVWALLLISASWVVWRQSHALDVLRVLDGLRQARAELEAERVGLLRRLERAESRSRVVGEARELGLRVPRSTEIVILQVSDDAGVRTHRPVATERGAGGRGAGDAVAGASAEGGG